MSRTESTYSCHRFKSNYSCKDFCTTHVIQIKSYLIAICLLFLYSSGFSQIKYEKELRLKERYVPQSAIQFVEGLGFEKKIKWYKEIGINKSSIEAKTKSNRKKYSIEFNVAGELEDVEIEIKQKEIPQDVNQRISLELSNRYGKYKIQKIQIQYLGEESHMIPFISENREKDYIQTNYEIVLKTKVKGSFKQFEYLFSDEGAFIHFAEIVTKNRDNIEY